MSNVTAPAPTANTSKPLGGRGEDPDESDDSDDGRVPWANRAGSDSDSDVPDVNYEPPEACEGTIGGLLTLASVNGKSKCPCCTQTFRTQMDPLRVLSIWYGHGVESYRRKVNHAKKGVASDGHVRMCELLVEHGYHSMPYTPAKSPFSMSKADLEEWVTEYNIALSSKQYANVVKTASFFESKNIATVRFMTTLAPLKPPQLQHALNTALYECWDRIC
jgi:hypothetical protein